MATFTDLTQYSYLPTELPMINIGWLGTGADFHRGSVRADVINALLLLAADQQNIMRGLHSCEFCDEESPIRLAAPVSEGWVALGMGEIHVRGRGGQVYAAPSLVIHYILEHGYLPPEEFQQAVLDTIANGSTPASGA